MQTRPWRAPVLALGLMVLAAGSLAACDNDEDDLVVPATEATTTTEAGGAGQGEGGESVAEASVSFAEPQTGATVARRFEVAFAAENFTVEPAGEVHEGAGHLHVMVDVGCVEPGEVIAKDDQHVHFGKGQTEGQLFLEPGEHELCLQAGDGEHVALDLTDTITVTVDESLPYVTLEVPEGETVSSPVPVTFEAHNFTVAPAGEVVEGEGHFHVMVDRGCMEPGQTIPSDDQHLHFGKAQTEAELELAPGEHTLCLQLADGAHVALPYTHSVTVTVA